MRESNPIKGKQQIGPTYSGRSELPLASFHQIIWNLRFCPAWLSQPRAYRMLPDVQGVLSPTMSDSLSSGVSTNGVKTYLDKEQLQQLDAFGRRILSQQTEHNNRVRRLHGLEAQSGDNEELDSEIRERHRELTEMAKAWDEDNAQLTQPLSLKVRLSCSLFDLGNT